MNSESEETEDKPQASPKSETSSTSGASTGVVFEAATQTPTSEHCDSPLFTQKGYCLKTTGHSNNALTNIQRMRQHDQVSFIAKTKTCMKQ